VSRGRSVPAWQSHPDLDDSVLVWRAAVRQGLTRRRSLLHPLGGGYGVKGLMGGLGAATGGRLFTGPAADALGQAQQSAIRGSSPSQDAASARTAALEFAAQDLLDRFNSSERTHLREAGELPDWFPTELKVKAKEIQKRRRHSSR
jgi:hypothetical protein